MTEQPAFNDLLTKYPCLANVTAPFTELSRKWVVNKCYALALEHAQADREDIAYGITKVLQTESVARADRLVIALIFAGVEAQQVVYTVNRLISSEVAAWTKGQQGPPPPIPSDELVDELVLAIVRSSITGRYIASLADTLPGYARGRDTGLDVHPDELFAIIIASLGRLMDRDQVRRIYREGVLPGGMQDALYIDAHQGAAPAPAPPAAERMVSAPREVEGYPVVPASDPLVQVLLVPPLGDVEYDFCHQALNGDVLGVPYCPKCKAALAVPRTTPCAAPAEVRCACGTRCIEQQETWFARVGAAVDALNARHRPLFV